MRDLTTLEYANPSGLREPGRVARFFLRPIGWPTHAATAVLVAWVLFAAAPPRGYFGMMILSVYLVLAIGAWWAGRGLLRLILRRRFREAAVRAGAWWQWLVLPAALGGAFVLIVTGATSATAFAVSRPALERFARAAHAGTVPLPAERWCGVYKVQVSPGDVDDAGVILWLPGSGFLDRNGLYFRAAAGPTTATSNLTTERLGGPWETVNEDW